MVHLISSSRSIISITQEAVTVNWWISIFCLSVVVKLLVLALTNLGLDLANLVLVFS